MNSFFDEEYLQAYINERAAKLIADLDLSAYACAIFCWCLCSPTPARGWIGKRALYFEVALLCHLRL